MTRYRPATSLRCRPFRLAGGALQALDHRVEPDLARAESDALHHVANEIAGDREGRRRRLAVHRGEEDREERGDRRRLARIEVGVEVELAVAQLGEDVDPRLALGYRERRAVERRESLGQRLELLRVLHQRLHLVLAGELPEIVEDTLDGGRGL